MAGSVHLATAPSQILGRTLSGLSSPSLKADSIKSDGSDVVGVSQPTDDMVGGRWYSRNRFYGAVLFNFVTFILPALYGTLSKLWIANIDASRLATTDTYTYAGTVTEVINEGLPRAAFLIIGNKAGRTLHERLSLSVTLISFQMALGLVLSFALFGAASQFAAAFVPPDLRYVRIAAFSSLFGAISTSIAAATRSLDRPDVPLAISLCSTSVNIVLDMLFLSTFRPSRIVPTLEMQAGTRLACDGAAAIVGLCYFIWTVHKLLIAQATLKPAISWNALKILATAGAPFFLESAVRNALYLYQTSGVISLSQDYATAWGVFNTIRWGLIMVPVQTLEATSLVFVGHRYGLWNKTRDGRVASWRDLLFIAKPALVGAVIALLIETILCLALTFRLIYPFAHYISNSDSVSSITAHMWRSMDWTYVIGYALSTLLATILSATRPLLYLANSLMANLLYVLPWTIAIKYVTVKPNNEWFYYSWIFGGSLVFSDFTVGVMLAVWQWRLRRKAGKGVLDQTA